MLGERNYSVGVFRSGVLASGFPVVARLAKRLPIRIAPHQVVIATVRNDVVNDRCGHELALCQTLHA